VHLVLFCMLIAIRLCRSPMWARPLTTQLGRNPGYVCPLACVYTLASVPFLQGLRMDMIKWMAAFDGHALAADACGIWSYAAAKAHLRICMQVACESGFLWRVLFVRPIAVFCRPCLFKCAASKAPTCTVLRRSLQEGMASQSWQGYVFLSLTTRI